MVTPGRSGGAHGSQVNEVLIPNESEELTTRKHSDFSSTPKTDWGHQIFGDSSQELVSKRAAATTSGAPHGVDGVTSSCLSV